MPAKAKELTEQEILQYCKDHNMYTSMCYCRDCGKLIAYDNKPFTINSVTKELIYNRGNGGLSFLSERVYNGHTYHLCRCYDCVCKAYPEFKNVRFKFAHKAAKYTQYGFGVSDEDFGIVSKDRQSVTKEKMIKKYGLNEGQTRWDEYRRKQAVTNTFEYKHKKYGMSEEEFYQYNRLRSVTLKNMIERYGEVIGKEKWEEYRSRQRYTCSLEYFISTYGETDGKIKYDLFSQKRAEVCSTTEKHSNISDELFDKLITYFPDHISQIFYAEDEYQLNTEGGHYYYLDYFDRQLNIVIEFFGDFYHFNPQKYNGDEVIRNLLVQDKWDKDAARIKDIQKTLNCKVIVVWESTYRSDKAGTVKAIVDMINCKDTLDDITYI